MNKWEKGVTKYLNEAEYRFLNEYDRWLRNAFLNIPLGADEHVIHSFHVSPGMRLSPIVFRHSVDGFTMGQAHGDVDCKDVRSEHRKLANLPNVPVDTTSQGNGFIPEDAIKALQARALQLAGGVENDITSAIKEILLKYLVGVPRKDAEQEISALLEHNMNRASLIVTTETTYAYNRGRLISYVQNKVDYVMFRAVMDARTCQICASRDGKIAPIDAISGNTPPVHGRCRCVLSPVYSDLQPELMTPERQDWSKVAPLPKGWVA